jgi:hypothetical protein
MREINNYWLYNNPATGTFVFLPHGMDQMASNKHE